MRPPHRGLPKLPATPPTETRNYIAALQAQRIEAERNKVAADAQVTSYERLQAEMDRFQKRGPVDTRAPVQRLVNGDASIDRAALSATTLDQVLGRVSVKSREVGEALRQSFDKAAASSERLKVAFERQIVFDPVERLRDGSAVIDRVAVSATTLEQVLGRVNAKGRGVGEALSQESDKAANSSQRLAADLELVKRAIDPTRIAQQQLDAELARADQALARVEIGMEEYGIAVNRAADNYQALVVGARLGTAAQQRVIDTSRASRTAFIGLGQQMQDVVVQAQFGTNAFTIFAQQVPQAAFALSLLEGSANKTQARIGKFATFLSGPWGAAIFAATAVLGPYIARLLDTEDASKAAEEAGKSLAQRQLEIGNFFDETTGRIKENSRALIENAQAKVYNRTLDLQKQQRERTRGIGDVVSKSTSRSVIGFEDVIEPGTGIVRQEKVYSKPNSDLIAAIRGAGGDADKIYAAVSAVARSKSAAAAQAQQLSDIFAQNKLDAREIERLDAMARSFDSGSLDSSLRKPETQKKGPKGADPAKAAESAARETFRLSEFAADAEDKIDRMRQSFTDTPPAIARANDALATMDDLSSDIDEQMRRGLDPKIAAALKGELEKMRPVIEDSINGPFRDLLESSRESAAIQNLQIAGRTEEAEVLSRVLQLNRQQKALSDEQVQSVYDVVLQERARSRELEKQNQLRQRDAALVDATRDNVRGALQDLSRGGGASAIGKAFSRQFDLLLERQVDNLFDSLFGNFFQSERDKALGFDLVKKASIAQVDAIRTTITALNDLAGSFRDATDTVRAANDNQSGFVAADGAIEVQRSRLRDKFDLEGEFDLEFGAGPRSIAPSDFTATLARKLATAVGGTEFGNAVGDAVSKGMSRNGAAYGAIAGGLAFGGKGSPLFSAIGGAVGEKVLGPAIGKGFASIAKGLGDLGGPLGGIIGGLAGGLLGSALTSTPRASATIGGVNGALGVVSTRGNSASRRKASEGAAGEALDTLDQIAEALGATINASLGSVSIGVRKGNYRVDTSGSGATKTSRGAIDFGEDSASAIKFATMDLIQDGVLEGLRASTQRLLQQSKDLETAVNRAVDFEGVFAELKSIKDPVGAALDALDKQFDRLKGIFDEAGATTQEYADLEELYGFRRAEAIKQARDSFLGSLLDLRDQLTIGDTSLSVRSRLEAAQAQYNPLADRVRAGDVTAFDDFSQAAQTLLDLERELYGSTSPFFALRDDILGLTNTAIDAQSAIADAAISRDSPFSSSSVPTTDNASVVSAIEGQTKALVDAIYNSLGAVNDKYRHARPTDRSQRRPVSRTNQIRQQFLTTDNQERTSDMMMQDPYAALTIRAQNRDKLPAPAGSAAGTMPARRADTVPTRTASEPTSRYPYLFTQGDLEKAVASARNEERARVAAAFNAEASHGRERVCATLLTSPHSFTGSAIASQIAQLPTDAELGAREARSQSGAGKRSLGWRLCEVRTKIGHSSLSARRAAGQQGCRADHKRSLGPCLGDSESTLRRRNEHG